MLKHAKSLKQKALALSIVLLLTISQASAHFIWIETNQQANLNTEQDIKVFFGEFSYGKYEAAEGRSFSKIKDFSLVVHQPDGSKIDLKATANGDHYLAKYTPKIEGTHTVILNHNKIPVYDLSKYGHGIFKANYHATAKVQVGKKTDPTVIDNEESITVKNISEQEGDYKLQVWYKGKILADTELSILAPDQWNKKIRTDENGVIAFRLPWKSIYVVEATFREDVKGVYLNTEYDYVWHCCTLSIKS